MLGHIRPASESRFGWRYAGGPIVAQFYVLILGYSPPSADSKRGVSITQSTVYPLCEAFPEVGTDRLGMRIAVDWDIKTQTIQETTAYSVACMITHTHAVSEINSSTLNCRRVYVLKRGVTTNSAKKMKMKKSKMVK